MQLCDLLSSAAMSTLEQAPPHNVRGAFFRAISTYIYYFIRNRHIESISATNARYFFV